MNLAIELKITIVIVSFYILLTSVDAGYGNYGHGLGYFHGYGGGGGHDGYGQSGYRQGGYGQQMQMPYYYRPQKDKKYELKKAALGVLAGLTGGLLLLGGLMPTMAMGAMAAGLPFGAGALGGLGAGGLGAGAIGGGLPLLGGAGAGAGALPGVIMGKRSVKDDDTINSAGYEQILLLLKHQLSTINTPKDCHFMMKACNKEIKDWVTKGLLIPDPLPSVKSKMHLSSEPTVELLSKGDSAVNEDIKPEAVFCNRLLPQCFKLNTFLSSSSSSSASLSLSASSASKLQRRSIQNTKKSKSMRI